MASIENSLKNESEIGPGSARRPAESRVDFAFGSPHHRLAPPVDETECKMSGGLK